jgi:tRNA(Glu) U13 pseudouridine synthase TruD
MAEPRESFFPWPRTATPALASATLRAAPEDFVVEEQMPYVLAGAGEHLWVKLRKRGYNTEQVAKQLARTAGVTRREVGYAGMKDRHAITVQWFSLHLAGRPDPDWDSLPDGMEVVESTRHSRKLKTGALAGNRFMIVLRDCSDGSLIHYRDALLRRGEEVRKQGVPNYFGEQRFGHGGGNIAAARATGAGDRERVVAHHLRGEPRDPWRECGVLAGEPGERTPDHPWIPPRAHDGTEEPPEPPAQPLPQTQRPHQFGSKLVILLRIQQLEVRVVESDAGI